VIGVEDWANILAQTARGVAKWKDRKFLTIRNPPKKLTA